MDKAFLEYYENELIHLRHSGRAFAKDFPKIASRLQITEQECADPYVERLLEGVAFLTARIAKRLDGGAAHLSADFLRLLSPQLEQPQPSRGVVSLHVSEGSLFLPAQSQITSTCKISPPVECIFVTREQAELHPIRLQSSTCSNKITGLNPKYLTSEVTHALELNFLALADCQINKLDLYAHLPDKQVGELLEQICNSTRGALSKITSSEKSNYISPSQINDRIDEFDHDDNTLMADFFHQQSQMSFVSVSGIQATLKKGETLQLVFLLSKPSETLLQSLQNTAILPNCVRVINRFSMRSVRHNVTHHAKELLVADSIHPNHYEVLELHAGECFDANNRKLFNVQPLYRVSNGQDGRKLNYFHSSREGSILRSRNRASSYNGSDIYISFSGPDYTSKLDSIKTFSVRLTCSNRDLPIFLSLESPVDVSKLEGVHSGSFVIPPSAPAPSLAEGAETWRLIAAMRLKIKSLYARDASSVRQELLEALHSFHGAKNSAAQGMLESITKLKVGTTSRLIPFQGELCPIQTWHLEIKLSQAGFVGGNMYLFAHILAKTLFNLAEINSHIEVSIIADTGATWSWKNY